MFDNKTILKAFIALALGFLISIVSSTDFIYIPVLSAIGFIAVHLFLNDKHLEAVRKYLTDGKMNSSFSFVYRCLLFNVAISVFIALVILTAWYKGSSDANISLMLYIPFLTIWLIIYIIKKYTNLSIYMCDSKKGETKSGSKK